MSVEDKPLLLPESFSSVVASTPTSLRLHRPTYLLCEVRPGQHLSGYTFTPTSNMGTLVIRAVRTSEDRQVLYDALLCLFDTREHVKLRMKALYALRDAHPSLGFSLENSDPPSFGTLVRWDPESVTPVVPVEIHFE